MQAADNYYINSPFFAILPVIEQINPAHCDACADLRLILIAYARVHRNAADDIPKHMMMLPVSGPAPAPEKYIPSTPEDLPTGYRHSYIPKTTK